MAASDPDPPPARRRPPYVWTFVLGAGASSLGDQMAAVALPIALLAHGHGPAGLGLVMGASMLAKLIFLLVGGVVSDRLDRRRVLVAGHLVMGAAQALTAVTLLSGAGGLYLLTALQLLYGSASGFATPALTGVIPSLVPIGEVQRANALMRTAVHIGWTVGPAAAAGIAAAAGPEWTLLADGVTFGVSALTIARLPQPRSTPSTRSSPISDLVAGWSMFARTTWIWLMVGSFAVYQATVLPSIFVLGPLATHGASSANVWAATLTARGVGAILGGALLLRWRPTRPLAVAAAILLMDLPFLLGLALMPIPALLIVTAALSAGGVAIADTLWETCLQERVDASLISRISSYDWMGSMLFAPFGYVAVGIAAQGIGAPVTLAAVAGAHAVMWFLLPLARPIRSLRRAPDMGGIVPPLAATK